MFSTREDNEETIRICKVTSQQQQRGTSAAALDGRIGKVVASHAEGCKVDSQLRLR